MASMASLGGVLDARRVSLFPLEVPGRMVPGLSYDRIMLVAEG